ncbi:ABATE domain-containing protein [Streptomyces sp. NPDC026672]|uniref:CGNR zinc finger domain-containing protein n=1 Tax=unclassified Streptomyces TaxID=2593676 RepID=UPI00341005E8
METSAPLLNEPLPVELMNTIRADRDGVYDALRDPDGIRGWLRAVAPRIEVLDPGDLDALSIAELAGLGTRLTGLRDALRRLAAEATGDPRTAGASGVQDLDAAVTALNRAAGDTPHWSTLSWSPGATPARRLRSGGPAASTAVSAVAEEAVVLFGGEDRLRLRACLAPGCVLYFLKDHPRREWCSAGCGNRARSARHYRRHRNPTA